MHYFVDGYNFLFSSYEGSKKSLELQREQLLKSLNTLAKQLSLHITIVFDGRSALRHFPAKRSFDALEIIFAPHDQSADEYIIDELSRTNASACIVVTQDRELAKRSSQMHAKVLSISAFTQLLHKKMAKKRSSKRTKQGFDESDKNKQRLLEIFEKRLNE